MSDIDRYLTDAVVERAAQALHDQRSMECGALHEVGQPLGGTIYDNERRTDARAALTAAAPLLAAKAWEQGYRAANMEWEHLYDGHTVEPEDLNGLCIECGQGNPYKRNEER